jgi:uncharacterized membrane protein YbhN (UPF0104 family)
VLAGGVVLATAVAAAVAVAGAAGIGPRLAEGRPQWLAVAGGFELISTLGFVAALRLCFGDWLPDGKRLRIGFAARGATILLPAGGLVAIGFAAKTLGRRGASDIMARSRTIAFVLITNAPNLIVLGAVGLALGAGVLDGPRQLALTFVPAVLALGTVALIALLPLLSHRRTALAPRARLAARLSAAGTQLELGVLEAGSLLKRRSWNQPGAFAYYAFDNAVLWATFRAFGHTHPPFAVLTLGYLLGSVAGSLPIPAGVGVVDGGMIGVLALFGVPAICAGVAVLAYRAVSIGLPLLLALFAVLGLGAPALRRRARVARSAPAGQLTP